MFGIHRLVAESPFVRRAARENRAVRLFCFPHAGAGAGAFAEWPQLLPAEVEVVAVQLPGREDRAGEEPFTEARRAIRAVAVALRPYLQGRYGFFGHSGGAILAFELARALQARGLEPERLFLSGQPAPGHPVAGTPLHTLDDAAFSAEIRRLGGTVDGVAGDEALMDVLLPTLRADFALWERHECLPGDPLSADVTVLGGVGDPRAPQDSLTAWRTATRGDFDVQLFDGGHFYLNDHSAEVTRVIADSLLRRRDAVPARAGERSR